MKKKFTTNIDKELLAGIKKKAIDEGTHVNAIIEDLIKKYLNKKKEEDKMKKLYKDQVFTFENGKDVLIDVVVEDGEVTEIIAGEKIGEFEKGKIINVDGEDSIIRSQDININFLED